MKRSAGIASVVILTACGGGGGSVGPTPIGPADATTAITPSNAIAIIRSVADTDAISQDLIVSTLVNTAAATAALIENPAPSASPAAQSTEFCGSGTADVNENGLIATFDFVDCLNFNYSSENLGELSIDGLLNGNLFVEVSANSASETDFNATVDLTDFSIDRDGTLSWGDGRLVLDFFDSGSDILIGIDSAEFDFSRNMNTRSLEDYEYLLFTDSTDQSETGTGGLMSSDFNGLVFFVTNQAFERLVGDPYPASGVRNIYGADDARIRVQAVDNDTARVQVDADGTEGFELDCNYAWTVLLGEDDLVACAGG